MVMGLPNIDDLEFCEGRILGKQSRNSFPVGKSWRASRHIELVHADLCGPMNTESLNDSKLLLKNKGIHRELTSPYTPEQNGIAERKNRTVMEMARSMLKEKKLPDNLWAEAVATDVYLLNLSPTKAVLKGHLLKHGEDLQSKAYRLYNPVSGKIIISRDVMYNEAATLPWSVDKDGKTILIMCDDDTPTVYIEPISEPSSPTHSSPHSPKSPSSGSSSSSDALSSDSPPPMFRDLKDVYDSFQFALYVSDPTDYDEAAKNQYNADESIQKHKARLVAKGYSQKQGIDYEETFSPVVRFETVRIVLALATQLKLPVYQFDVKSAFLNDDLDEEKEDGIFVCQKKYATDLLKRFHISNCELEATLINAGEKLQLNDGTRKADGKFFRSLVGGLNYLTHTRPDIAFPVSYVSKYMHSPTKQHLGAAKRILHYIAGTTNFGIWYTNVPDFNNSELKEAIDACLVVVSEAEYAAGATEIFCDNRSAIAMAKNPAFHARTKHIDVQHHFIRHLVADNRIELKFCGTNEQTADIFTKSLPLAKHQYFMSQLGVCEFESRGSVE
ncbi:retrovirus-related pol polyprotein from transposon TNT 1-94 [Tanacetum coccineum]